MTLNPQQFHGQLKMFMTPEEIKSSFSPADAEGWDYESDAENDARMWEDKEQRVASTGFAARLHKEGVQEPVSVLHSQLMNADWYPHGSFLIDGHHRTAGAAPGSYLPVMHHEDWQSAATQVNDRMARGAYDLMHLEDDWG